MIDSSGREIKSVALGYACFTIMWCIYLGFFFYILGWDGLKRAVEEPELVSGTLIYIAVTIAINCLMAIAVWNVLRMSARKKRLVIFFSIGLAAFYLIGLLYSLWQWSTMQISYWFNPKYNIFPLIVIEIGYGYLALTLIKTIKISNNKT